MFQRGDLVAQTVVGQCAEVIPAGIAVRGIAQCVEGLLIAAETDVVIGSLLIAVAPIGLVIAALLIAAETAKGVVLAVAAIAAALGLLVFLRIFDLVVGSIDLLHLFGGHLITGI